MGLNADQGFFILTLTCFAFAISMLWRSILLKPFKLWTTFMHEFSHACAVWLCCHTVTGIEVNLDEGGLTHWKGTNVECAKHAVLPAGYIGSALWGAGTLLSCTTRVATQTMAYLLCAALAVCFFYALCGQTSETEHRFTTMAICLSFGALLGGLATACIADKFETCDIILEACLIWLGTLNMAFATIDIFDDTVRRSDERSDAYQYAKLWPCCFPRCVGAIWLLLSLFVFVGSIVWVMYITGEEDRFDDHWYNWFIGPIVLGFAFVWSTLTCCLPSLSCCFGSKNEGKPLLG